MNIDIIKNALNIKHVSQANKTCTHQYLSSTATPKLGMIPTRNKGTLVGSHVAKGTQKSAKPKHLGLSGYTEAGKDDC